MEQDLAPGGPSGLNSIYGNLGWVMGKEFQKSPDKTMPASFIFSTKFLTEYWTPSTRSFSPSPSQQLTAGHTGDAVEKFVGKSGTSAKSISQR